MLGYRLHPTCWINTKKFNNDTKVDLGFKGEHTANEYWSHTKRTLQNDAAALATTLNDVAIKLFLSKSDVMKHLQYE